MKILSEYFKESGSCHLMDGFKDPNKKEILIVDDDDAILDWFGGLQSKLPWHFCLLSDELKLLDVLKFSVPDLIIMDVNLKSFDGRKLGNVLSVLYDYTMPIVYMSSDSEALNDHGLGEASFIHKPLSKELVLKKLLKIF